MKEAVVNQWGASPRYTEFPDPQPRDGAVVATVEASALTNLTRGLVSGKHYASKELQLPAIPGVDGVARLDDGRRVYTGALAPYGMMAERTLISPHGALDLPNDVDSVVAAAVPNPGLSAWMSLEHGASVRPGENVLVLGATGVTGRVRAQALPRLFDMVASGELHLRTVTRPLTEVEQAWAATEPSGTRVVLTP
jgi:NADPH:quinone reductase-like Zn-dependent oxidoreductase